MPNSYGFLSTYPPTQCGLATFTASLAAALRETDDATQVGIVRVLERPDHHHPPEVIHELLSTTPGGEADAAEALSRFDVAIIQHEYGIYGGPDGQAVIEVMRCLRTPAIVVLHTVLNTPTVRQRQILEEVAGMAASVVVMTETAKRRLLDHYTVDPTKLALIAHGAPNDWEAIKPRTHERSRLVLTWGLLGPGKGIEWALDAVAALADLDPAPRYVVAGETHPHVVESEGERYRTMLETRAHALGIDHLVRFENRYLDRQFLRTLIGAADVVVLPYDSPDQVTSGVLIEAVAAGRPVVATAFPHAVELLSAGAGTIVRHRDSSAIASAVRRILVEPGVASAMAHAARRLGPDLTWTAVGRRYRALADTLQREVTPVGA